LVSLGTTLKNQNADNLLQVVRA